MGASVISLAVCVGTWTILLGIAAAMTALDTALTRVRIRDLLEEDGVTSTAKLWLRHAPSLRAAAAIGHTLALLAAGGAAALCFMLARPLMSAGTSAALVACMAIITLVIGELSPRYAGAWCARAVVVHLAPLLHIVAIPTGVLTRLLLTLARTSAHMVGIHATQRDPFAGDEEQADLTTSPVHGADMDLQQQRMIKAVFEFGDTIVREIMSPRTTMDALPLTASLNDAIRAAHPPAT